jgi:hypothetical protein
LFSVRILVCLLLVDIWFAFKTVLDNFGNASSHARNSLFDASGIVAFQIVASQIVGGWTINLFGGYAQGAAGLQPGQRQHLGADTFDHDVDVRHVGGSDHEKRFARTAASGGWENQILVDEDAPAQEVQTALAGFFPASAE